MANVISRWLPHTHQVRGGVVLLSALALQLGLAIAHRSGVDIPSQSWFMAVSYGLLLLGVASNVAFWGFRILLVGLLLNMVAMAANGWLMPVSPETLWDAGRLEVLEAPELSLPSPKSVLLQREETNLWPLTDVIVARPLNRIVSVGDLFVLMGAMLVVVELALRYRSGRRVSPSRVLPTGPDG